MEIKKDKIFELCAKTLDIPPEVAEHVWKSQFHFIRKWIESPEHPAIQLPTFGTFRLNYRYVDQETSRVIKKLKRTPKAPKLREKLKTLRSM